MERKEAIRELLTRERYDFSDLKLIMDLLRSEGGCPWDIDQTHGSIRSCMIEEAYEVVEAIDTENAELLREELGDVLFQVMFHARIEEERRAFDVYDVIHEISAKMIHRHPHVFGEAKVETSEETVSRWEEIKTEEKQRTTLSSRLRAVPPMLPALMRASKILKKAGLTEDQSSDQLHKTLLESVNGLTLEDPEAYGALLLAVARYGASRGWDAEQLLGQAVDALIREVEEKESLEKEKNT